MNRFALVTALSLAACTSGFESKEASLTNTMPAVKSAAARSFTGPDATGKDVLGWTIQLYSNAPGADCQGDVKKVGSIAIYTSQDGTSAKKAKMQTGDIAIVTQSPPQVNGNAVATMVVDQVGSIIGNVSITDLVYGKDGVTTTQISGTVTSSGSDGSGNSVSMNGMFVAPVCE